MHICFLAVVHLPSEVLGQAGMWEDPQRSETGLHRPLSGPLAHGLQGVCQHKELDHMQKHKITHEICTHDLCIIIIYLF